MIVRYGELISKSFQSQRVELEMEFKDDDWTHKDAMIVVTAIVKARLGLENPEYEEAANLCGDLGISLEEIERSEKVDPKGWMHCSSCGMMWAERSQGCPNCGNDGVRARLK